MIRYVEHAARGRVPVPGSPLRLSDSPVGPLRPAPPLGQSTEEVLAELAGREDPADEARTEPEHVLHS
jgi:crotonobetainyl-CoA:carnitine CoA-transferase CaiB-like acyl-CoA transferase